MFHIDILDNHFYCKEYANQDIIILFERPHNAKESECDSYVQNIYDIIHNNDDDLFASDIIEKNNWPDNVRNTISRTLYIQYIQNDPKTIFGSDVYAHSNGIYIGEKLIAKVVEKKKKRNIYIILLLLLFCALVSYFIYVKIEKDRVSTNLDSYNSNISDINYLDNYLKESTSSNQSYAKFINKSQKEKIAYFIDSIRNVAEHSYDNCREKGIFSAIQIDKEKVIASINQIIDDAQNKEKAQNNNHNKISLSTEFVESISNKDNNISETSHNQNSQQNAGKQNEPNKNKEIATTNRSQPANTTKEIDTNKKEKFKSLVESADTDFVNYYLSEGKDQAAAIRAYNKYSEALKIQFDPNISEKQRKLKKNIP